MSKKKRMTPFEKIVADRGGVWDDKHWYLQTPMTPARPFGLRYTADDISMSLALVVSAYKKGRAHVVKPPYLRALRKVRFDDPDPLPLAEALAKAVDELDAVLDDLYLDGTDKDWQRSYQMIYDSYHSGKALDEEIRTSTSSHRPFYVHLRHDLCNDGLWRVKADIETRSRPVNQTIVSLRANENATNDPEAKNLLPGIVEFTETAMDVVARMNRIWDKLVCMDEQIFAKRLRDEKEDPSKRVTPLKPDASAVPKTKSVPKPVAKPKPKPEPVAASDDQLAALMAKFAKHR